MKIPITSPQELGLLLRASRKQQDLRMDDLAGIAGVGPVFVREVERGKTTVQLGKVMHLLVELGVTLHADVPAEVGPVFETLKNSGVKPFKPRRSGADRPKTFTDKESTA